MSGEIPTTYYWMSAARLWRLAQHTAPAAETAIPAITAIIACRPAFDPTVPRFLPVTFEYPARPDR